MNLIESLGGYLKAKECLSTPTARECIKEELRKELLEYRMEHNIFEVGDWVVCHIDSAVMKVSRVVNSEYVYVESDYEIALVSSKSVKHATNAEIEAGKRL